MDVNEILRSRPTKSLTVAQKRALSPSLPEPEANGRTGLARFYLDAELEYLHWRPRPRLVFPRTSRVM